MSIAPKKRDIVTSCSRGCFSCGENRIISDFELRQKLNLSLDNPFYQKLANFFKSNPPKENREVNFFYYGDFFTNNQIVTTGIQNLYEHNIISDTTNVGVWIQAYSKLNTNALNYIKDWGREGCLSIKFSLDLSSQIDDLLNYIRIINKNLLVIQSMNVSDVSFVLHLHNVTRSFCSLHDRKKLFYYLQHIRRKYSFLHITFHTPGVVCNLDGEFTQDTLLSYYKNIDCRYMNEDLIDRFTLQDNLKSEEDVYLDNIDILEDSLCIHDPECKKLSDNHFGTIEDSTRQINYNIRRFIERQNRLSTSYNGKEDFCFSCLAFK